MEKDEFHSCLTAALSGDSKALEMIVIDVQDFVFNISLRMLGSLADAQDATQEILLRIISHLSEFEGKSSFKTWVYRIACNYVINYKKSMFAKQSLSFDFYANDIKYGVVEELACDSYDIEREMLVEELKLSCTNVMLQCFDAQTRCIFILGTMFHIESKVAADILDMTPENYRQKLSRARHKMADFLSNHCGLTETGLCHCGKRLPYAIQQHRINPTRLELQSLQPLKHSILLDIKDAMETIDDTVIIFDELPNYKATIDVTTFVNKLLQTEAFQKICNF